MATAVDISHSSGVTIGSITSSGADTTLSIAHSRGVKVGNIDSSDKKAVSISQSESVSVDAINLRSTVASTDSGSKSKRLLSFARDVSVAALANAIAASVTS